LEKQGKLVGYGESIYVEDAFNELVSDYRAQKEYVCKYLTGGMEATSALDGWLLKGHAFDVDTRGIDIRVTLEGYEKTTHPDGYSERVMAGETLTFENRGYTYEMHPYVFPNGDPCTQISVIASPEDARSNADPWHYPIKKVGSARTLTGAFAAAFAAPSVE